MARILSVSCRVTPREAFAGRPGRLFCGRRRRVPVRSEGLREACRASRSGPGRRPENAELCAWACSESEHGNVPIVGNCSLSPDGWKLRSRNLRRTACPFELFIRFRLQDRFHFTRNSRIPPETLGCSCTSSRSAETVTGGNFTRLNVSRFTPGSVAPATGLHTPPSL